ncbi:MAG: Gfo/Idh/MocA family oxidoreductase [Desulfocapsaceae bacterium]
MANSMRFVVLGSGNICRTYLQVAKNLENAEIVGIVSRSGNRPAEASNDIPVMPTLQDMEVEFDAVILATPNGLHHKGAIQAAQLGKHVLTEKPLDINRENMDSMIQSCQMAGVKIGVTYQHRMSPDNQTIKKLIEAGSLGRIFSADFTVYCWRDQAYYNSAEWRGGWAIDGGGPFIQQACHQIDLYAWFFGMPANVISMTDRFMHDIEVEDHGVGLFRHANGMIGTFIASTVAYPGFDPVFTIITEKGTVIMQNGRITGWHIRDLENPSIEPEGALHSGASSAAVTDTSLHEAIVEDFINAVAQNREPFVTGESARETTELILQIYGRP